MKPYAGIQNDVHSGEKQVPLYEKARMHQEFHTVHGIYIFSSWDSESEMSQI